MKKTKKLLFSAITMTLGLAIAVNVLAANIPNTQLGSKVQAEVKNIGISSTIQNNLRQAVNNAIEKCPTIESRIQMKIVNFDNNKIRHLNAYNNLKERLAKVESRLADKGLDTTKLKSYLSVLNSKIDKFTNDYAAYIDKLKETQTFVCGKSKGQFLAKLKEARTALKTVHQDILDIRSYYVNTIKPELQNLKQQINDLNKNKTQTRNQVQAQIQTMEQSSTENTEPGDLVE